MFHDYSSNRYSIRFHHFNEFYSGSIFQRDFNLNKFFFLFHEIFDYIGGFFICKNVEIKFVLDRCIYKGTAKRRRIDGDIYIFYNIRLITIAREEFLTFNCYKNNSNEFLSWRFKIFKQGLNFR